MLQGGPLLPIVIFVGCFLSGPLQMSENKWVKVGFSPFPVIVTTRIITFLVGNPYKPSFPLLLGRGTTQGKGVKFQPILIGVKC